MTPEDTLQRQLQRAGEARQLLDSRIFQEAKTDLENRLRFLRRDVPITAKEAHTQIILMDQCWGMLLEYFEQIALTGKLAQQHLDETQKQRESWNERLRAFFTSGRSAL